MPRIPSKLKIHYNIERIEEFLPKPFRCYKCNEYGHHKENCGKFYEKKPDHSTDECTNSYKYTNPNGDDTSYEKLLKMIKSTRNIPFLKARKVVEATNQAAYSRKTIKISSSKIAITRTIGLAERLQKMRPKINQIQNQEMKIQRTAALSARVVEYAEPPPQ